MTGINNDTEFRAALQSLNATQQRQVAVQFIENVFPLSNDDRVELAMKTAASTDAVAEQVNAALKAAKAAVLDSHTRCGSEGDWAEQSGYFVARAAVSALTPMDQSKAGGPAWQTAMSCRMARTSQFIDTADTSTSQESETQYHILEEFLNA